MSYSWSHIYYKSDRLKSYQLEGQIVCPSVLEQFELWCSVGNYLKEISKESKDADGWRIEVDFSYDQIQKTIVNNGTDISIPESLETTYIQVET